MIVTCRPPREGGRWQGSEAARLAVLRQAAALGADYVDLEWDAAGEIASLDRSRTRVILSRHDFAAMPDDLAARAASLWQAGADVVKLVGMAQRLADCAPVLRLLAAAQRPTIAIAMGQHGLLTRVLAFRYRHALLSFAAPDPAPEGGAAGTAPGQISLSAMRDDVPGADHHPAHDAGGAAGRRRQHVAAAGRGQPLAGRSRGWTRCCCRCNLRPARTRPTPPSVLRMSPPSPASSRILPPRLS